MQEMHSTFLPPNHNFEVVVYIREGDGHVPGFCKTNRRNLMNKKYLLGGLLMGAAALSHAQATSGVTIYGLVDTGVEYLSSQAGGGSSFRMPTNTATFPSRIGFRGTEDLGNGLSAIFTLENGFGADAGTANQGSRLFGRQAWVGLASKSWGQVTLGRQYTAYFIGSLDADILGSNVFGTGSLDAYFPNGRADNAIGYRGTFNGFTVMGHYSLGRDVVNGSSPAATGCAGENTADKQACRGYSAMLKYDAASWGVAAVYDRQNGGTGAFAGLNTSDKHDSRAMFNGYAKLDAWKLGAGFVARSNDGAAASSSTTGAATRRSNLYWLEAAYSVTPAFVIDGGWFRLDYKNSSGKADLYALRATYNFSKRTAVYGTVGRISNDGSLNVSVDGGQVVGGPTGSGPVAGGSQNGAMVGIRHWF
jgi:predicted porin